MSNWPNPFIEQRADPYILRHQDHYYFIASVPEYDRLEIRRAATLEGLREAPPVVVWRKPESGPMSQLIWAPELHEIDGKWYIYFAAAHTHDWTNSGCSSTGCLSSNVPTATRSAASGLKRSGKNALRYLCAGCHHLSASGQAVVSVGAESPTYCRQYQPLSGGAGKPVDAKR